MVHSPGYCTMITISGCTWTWSTLYLTLWADSFTIAIISLRAIAIGYIHSVTCTRTTNRGRIYGNQITRSTLYWTLCAYSLKTMTIISLRTLANWHIYSVSCTRIAISWCIWTWSIWYWTADCLTSIKISIRTLANWRIHSISCTRIAISGWTWTWSTLYWTLQTDCLTSSSHNISYRTLTNWFISSVSSTRIAIIGCTEHVAHYT